MRAPRYVPDIFENLNGMAIWLGISTFWGRLNTKRIFTHYENLFHEASRPSDPPRRE